MSDADAPQVATSWRERLAKALNPHRGRIDRGRIVTPRRARLRTGNPPGHYATRRRLQRTRR